MKATAIAPANIAFIKYWGKKDEVLRLPENGSLSMNLNNLLATATVEFSPIYTQDEITINGKIHEKGKQRIGEHLTRIRRLKQISDHAKVAVMVNFPLGTGLSSSAAVFAAVTLAGAQTAGLKLVEKELSILARQGSGSACRSIPDGFVEWLDGNTSETSYAVSFFPANYWDIVDVVVITSREEKDVATSEGMKLHTTSPFFGVRLSGIKDKLRRAKKLIRDKNFREFGELIEAEALEMHAIMLTSKPSLIYLKPETIKLMKLTQKWRIEGLPVYFTINTGQNIHLICEKKNVEKVKEKLKRISDIKQVIVNDPAIGARLSDIHLF